MSDSKLVVTKINEAVVTFLFDDFQAVELFADTGEYAKVGDIFVGYVSAVKKDIGAVFVDISKDITAYLSFDEINPSFLLNREYDGTLKKGDRICVQVKREALKTKFAGLSMNISIPGRYTVITSDDFEIHYSSKISKKKSFELKKSLNGEFSHGFIVRTNAGDVSADVIIREAVDNCAVLDDIIRVMKTRTVHSRLFETPPSYFERIKSMRFDSYSEIVTDYEDIYEVLRPLDNVRLYSDRNVLLKSVYGFDRAFHDATDKTVYLPCGGYLVIEPTEAMTVIDVNSGKFDRSVKKCDTVRIVNNEAADEICRQLRLRNISGIVLVDFINFEDENDLNELVMRLKKRLSDDPLKTAFVDVTKLGLVEITREKKYAPVIEEMRKINI